MNLEQLKKKCLECTECPVGGRDINGHLSNVFSNMNTDFKAMVVGQNPGRDEVEQGIPFVGVSGKFFDSAIETVGLSRDDFYISNVVKCYTPNNRTPSDTELENCRKFLDIEIKLIKPPLIVALGSLAFRQLTGMRGIMKHHGSPILSLRYGVPVIPLLHPSPLNTNHPDRRRMFIDGLKKVKSVWISWGSD
jgi:uracil-DNA glycosylase